MEGAGFDMEYLAVSKRLSLNPPLQNVKKK